MKLITALLLAVLAATTLELSALNVTANEHKKSAHDGTAPEWMKYTQPGEEHAKLKELEGKWAVSAEFLMDSGSKPETSKGSQTNKMIMGGRFLQSDHKGTAMGQPFNGMGLLGFDRVKGQYQSVWVDNMSTSLMSSSGAYDDSAKTITETGSFSCPMTGEKDKAYRAEWKFVDKNHYNYAMYTKDAAGKEFRSLFIQYTRK